jgi:hypothetical protein
MSKTETPLETANVRTTLAPASLQAQQPVASSPPRDVVRSQAKGTMARALPLLSAHAQRLGVPGIAGIAAFMFCITFWQTVLSPMHERVTKLRAAASSANTEQVLRGGQGPQGHAAAFIAELPDRNRLPAVLGAIVEQAEGAGLSLERGAYQWSASKTGLTARYQITLPVNGSYPAVRKFVDSTLAQVPAAALAGITIERPNVGDALVSADLHFEIYVRSNP